MGKFNDFALPDWINGNAAGSKVILAGSVGPSMSLNQLTKISEDPEATAKAFNLHDLNMVARSGDYGGKELGDRVASLYDQTKAKIDSDDVVIATATTGANMLLYQALLSPGDHVVCMYPVYGPLIEVPKLLGVDISYWKMKPGNGWNADIDELRTLVKPTTKMIIVNNPNNPTGSILSTSQQAEIIKVASEHNIIVHSDEIFRPLFHSGEVPTSIVEHSFYDKTVATGSLSKAWCFSGIRIGWCVTRDPEIKEALRSLREWSLQSCSLLDEVIAKEILSERCRPKIHARISNFAHENLIELQAFVKANPETVSWVQPAGGAIGFMKFSNPKTGEPVDDVAFCKALKKEAGVLLAPGDLTFGQTNDGDFKGYIRMHFTILPEVLKEGLPRISSFLRSQEYLNLGNQEHANGGHTNGA